ncbi:hypothetical protein ACG02S_11890 [Roseateles sp. DC23W]|uniref:Uncharacterized protein n=1 Tax=Pelomonas dachongensis TaxID=3299029 RepID=A0ABW7EM71_9BURK
MNSNFWSDNWWEVPIWLLGVAAVIYIGAYARRNPDASASRVMFFLFPALNPDRSSRPTSRWTFVAALSVIISIIVLEWQGN